MAKASSLLHNITLNDLEIAPSQIWGAVRLVPLLRSNVRGDLRLFKRTYNEDLTVVALDGPMIERSRDSDGKTRSTIAPGMKYISFVPHGLVLSWSDDGSPIAAFGGQIAHTDGKRISSPFCSTRLLHRMAKKESSTQLRFLPLHLAMEGFLAMFFAGPDIAWSEYSRYARTRGLGFRLEFAYSGRSIIGLENALRVFEIHPTQVGVLVFVADALASAFVVPSPEDYRALHASLIDDFFGELMYYYGMMHDTVYPFDLKFDDTKIDSLSDVRKELANMRKSWESFQGLMSEGLLQKQLDSRIICDAGPYRLQRFMTDLCLDGENHIGEAIVGKDGAIQYLKSYRLSAAQTRRVYLLSKLSEHNWNLAATASSMACTQEQLTERFEKAGFGYLLSDQVRRAALKTKKKGLHTDH